MLKGPAGDPRSWLPQSVVSRSHQAKNPLNKTVRLQVKHVLNLMIDLVFTFIHNLVKGPQLEGKQLIV